MELNYRKYKIFFWSIVIRQSLAVSHCKLFVSRQRSVAICNCSGQLLIEALVSISIILVGLVGILNLLANSMRLNRIVSDQYTATYLASEGIEVIRNIVDTNININRTGGSVPWNRNVECGKNLNATCTGGAGCSLNYNETVIDNNDANNNKKNNPIDFNPVRFNGAYYNNKVVIGPNQPTPFTRNVCVDKINVPGGQDYLKVQSVVTWKGSGGGSFKVELDDVFYER